MNSHFRLSHASGTGPSLSDYSRTMDFCFSSYYSLIFSLVPCWSVFDRTLNFLTYRIERHRTRNERFLAPRFEYGWKKLLWWFTASAKTETGSVRTILTPTVVAYAGLLPNRTITHSTAFITTMRWDTIGPTLPYDATSLCHHKCHCAVIMLDDFAIDVARN